MAKKDFETMKTTKAGGTAGAVLATIDKGKDTYRQQGTAPIEEQEQRKATLRTQGRKGCKAVRINLAITPDNHDYIKTMSRIRGSNLTEYVNFVIEQYKAEHQDTYKQAKAIIEADRGGK